MNQIRHCRWEYKYYYVGAVAAKTRAKQKVSLPASSLTRNVLPAACLTRHDAAECSSNNNISWKVSRGVGIIFKFPARRRKNANRRLERLQICLVFRTGPRSGEQTGRARRRRAPTCVIRSFFVTCPSSFPLAPPVPPENNPSLKNK